MTPEQDHRGTPNANERRDESSLERPPPADEVGLSTTAASPPQPRFHYGTVYYVADVGKYVTTDEVLAALRRHVRGDWGEIDDWEKTSNDEAVQSGDAVTSMFRTSGGVLFWVWTSDARDMTLVALVPVPEEQEGEEAPMLEDVGADQCARQVDEALRDAAARNAMLREVFEAQLRVDGQEETESS